MNLPKFVPQDGPATLNGPLLEGYAVPCTVYIGSGVIMGAEVLVVCADKDLAEGLAQGLDENGKPGAAFHAIVGQPPWYQNQTKDSTLQDAVAAGTFSEAAPIRQEAWDKLVTSSTSRKRISL